MVTKGFFLLFFCTRALTQRTTNIEQQPSQHPNPHSHLKRSLSEDSTLCNKCKTHTTIWHFYKASILHGCASVYSSLCRRFCRPRRCKFPGTGSRWGIYIENTIIYFDMVTETPHRICGLVFCWTGVKVWARKNWSTCSVDSAPYPGLQWTHRNTIDTA